MTISRRRFLAGIGAAGLTATVATAAVETSPTCKPIMEMVATIPDTKHGQGHSIQITLRHNEDPSVGGGRFYGRVLISATGGGVSCNVKANTRPEAKQMLVSAVEKFLNSEYFPEVYRKKNGGAHSDLVESLTGRSMG